MEKNSMKTDTQAMIENHLTTLTQSLAGRPVGSAANHAAEAYIADFLEEAGYEVERQGFDCVEWQLSATELWLGDGPLPVLANLYSPACDVTAPMVAVSNLNDLEEAEIENRIVVLNGELTGMPLFPKNYPFFTVDEHQRIIGLLEGKHPHAVITVSSKVNNPAPIIEDGDFKIPSATVAANVGAILTEAGRPVTLRIHSTTRPGRAANVIGRRAHPARQKIVMCAHFDTKPGTPGALDNAAGVATVMSLASRLAGGELATNLEVVAFNGEDHYAAPGEIAYLNGCGSEFGRIALLINVDGVALKNQPTTIAFFNCDDTWVAAVRAMLVDWPRIEESPPWPEGDHSIFALQGVPCIALTSGGIHALIDEVIHTPEDTLDLVEPVQIDTLVDFLHTLLLHTGLPIA